MGELEFIQRWVLKNCDNHECKITDEINKAIEAYLLINKLFVEPK